LSALGGDASQSREIRPLTSLRGVAAFAVVLQHFPATAQTLTPQWIPSSASHGYMAVDFFFVLSGFIMSLTYLPGFVARGRSAFPDFMVKRVARIVPMNLFALLALVVAGFLSRRLTGANMFFDDARLPFNLAANVLMLQGLGIGQNLNGPSWSISTEFAAYFLFPVFIFFRVPVRARGADRIVDPGACCPLFRRPASLPAQPGQ
jgi:peptidoglycan/LPS O-acetylase OafA/YrhL